MRNMRVTVCFGQTRVIVPCKGGATVAELVKEATARYKRAIGKTPKYWVKIRQLENAVDGGILDADDYVYDVAEDRDQLIAIFEEEDDQTYRPSYNGWDRHSGSGSDGHRSPPAFQNHPVLNNRYSNDNSPSNRAQAPTGNATVMKRNSQREPALEVNVGVEALKSSSNSQITVRRGSGQMHDFDGRKNEIQSSLKKPALSHQYYGRRESGSGQEEDSINQTKGNNRAHEIMITTTSNSSPEQNLSVVTASSDTNISVDSGHHSIKGKYAHDGKNYSNFVRGTTRHSMMGVLSEKNDNDIYQGSRQPPDGRKENSHGYIDLSGSYQVPDNVERYLPPPPVNDSFYPKFYNESQEMFVDIDERPLGVKVTRYRDRKIFCGLLVESVDEGGRSEREGLLQAGDVIVEINNYILAQYSHSVAQEIFKNAMKFPELQLRVYPVEERERASAVGNTENINNALNSKHRHTPSIPVLSLVEATPPKTSRLSSAKSLPDLNASLSSKSVQDVSLNGKVPLSARMSLDTLSNNTRKIGNMFEIKLRKGEQGLGFSITTRDTSIGDPGPIYIKNILPKGAAIQDGRLHAGDRLLKVNDVELTGHTQESAVNILRCIEVGDEASLVVSRHTQIMPRKMKDDPVADKVLSDDSHREHFKYEIALNDTGSAGLGISLKGNQSKKTKKDLGIFVKAVFHGGAAYQDGRLQPNDQLISVNGQSLHGMTNHEAIDTLRTSMSTVGNVRGMIQMVVARRKHVPGDPMSPQFSSEASSEMSDSLINERTGSSRTSEEKLHNHYRQTSTPVSRRALSPVFFQNNEVRHSRNISELSYNSSVFSTSLGDDVSWSNLEDPFESEIRSYTDRNFGGHEDNTLHLPRSSKVLSPSHVRRATSLQRHTSHRSTPNNQSNFADTINKYTNTSASPTSPQYKNIIGDLLRSAAIDNHYKPKLLSQKSGYSKNTRTIGMDPVRTGFRKPPARSHSLRGPRNKTNKDTLSYATYSTRVERTRSASNKNEKSPFDNMTAFEITGHSKIESYSEDSFRYNDEIPQQIDPNPLDSFADRSFEDSMTKHNANWTPSPEIHDTELDPFNRENIFRQSVSEKRRGGAATRDAQSTDTFKALKNKQMTNELVAGKKSPSPEVPKSPTVGKPLKWIKPSSSMKSDNSTRSSPLPLTPKSPTRRSPRLAKRNLNNSSNLPGFQDGTGYENKRSHTPLSFDYRSATPSSLSTGSGHYSSKNNINQSPMKSLPPLDYVNINTTPKLSKKSVEHSFSEEPHSPSFPVVRKSNSSDSLMTFGLYSKQPPLSPVSKPQSSPAKSTSSRGVPYLKPPVLPYSDLKHLAACCTPISSVANVTSPSYDRRPHPLTARREHVHVEPEVAVGPTLGIAKSSSLESLQTAVENFVDNRDSQYLKPQPRVIRGRVLNESFRAALDQSYDMESLGRKPMAPLKEEGNGTSPLAHTDGQKTHEKKRAGKSYKLFGIFRVGKNKRSLSSDRNLDAASRVPESEVHKRLLESKREDDFKKHQAETERIQAKAKAMREQQEIRKKDGEKYRSREDLVDSNTFEGRVRAPSVPVTEMHRMNIDPKVSYSETPSGRRSVDPSAMRDGSQPFELYMAKRPTSPVDYGDRNRQRRYDKRSNVNKVKTTPDYSSLPRQPRLESNAGAVPVNPDRVVTTPSNIHNPVTSPNTTSHVQGRSSENFSNQDFYNMQKPPGSKRQSAEPKLRNKQPGVTKERQGRPEKSKAGRTLYYDDTDSSVSPSSSFRSKTPQPQVRPRNNTQGKQRSKIRPASTINGFGMSPVANTFHREDSPEPPPVIYRNSGSPSQKGPYRHSVHVDAQVSRQYNSHTSRSRNKTPEPPSFKWKTELGRKGNDQSDSDSYRTSSPASSGNAERNRIAVKKMMREQQDPGRIVISPPYNL